jgi:iron complex transport system ATP-binding protein
MLEARAVTVTRRGRHLLEDVHVTIAPGRVTAIIGPNGAGKSTLLKVLAGEIRPSFGDVLLDRRNLGSYGAADLACRRAMVPQATTLSFPFLVIEVIRLGASVPGFDGIGSRARAIAEEALAALDLADFRQRLYYELSGGEKQRVHIARALCQLDAARREPADTAVLLLDEPTASLDLPHQALVLDHARRQAAAGWAVVAVLHDLNLAAAWADELVVLAHGRVLARGTPAAIFNDGILSAAYGCTIRANRTPPPGTPYMLPQLLRPDVEAAGRSADHAAPTEGAR